MSVHWFSTSVLFLGGTVAISKVVAKVKELWTERVTHFNTEEEMDHFFKNYGNISIGLILDQTDLITFHTQLNSLMKVFLVTTLCMRKIKVLKSTFCLFLPLHL